jgi:integrase
MRFAEANDYRDPGTNPVDSVPTMTLKARSRYITDSELRRIKVGAIYGDDGRRTRSGLMIAALVDLAYLTGQRIGDLLDLRWERDPDDLDAPHVTDAGMRFRPAKTRTKTGAAVLIEWTPRLRDAVDRIKRLQSERLLKRRAAQRLVSGYLITGQDGKQLSYWGASSAWQRAVKRAGVKGVHMHDIRAKALTDVEQRRGMKAARDMGTHATETQTADYVRTRGVRGVGATR